MCVHAKTCGSQVALEHTGDLYSCDRYVEPCGVPEVCMTCELQ